MWARILLLCLLVLPAVSGRAEPAAWLDEVVGDYAGPVLNGGQVQQVETHFFLDDKGALVGTYRVDDTPPFEGRLSEFREEAPYRGMFTWTDHFGQGVVHIRFVPQRGRFVGRWGVAQPEPGYLFNGRRVRPQVGS